VAEKLLEGICPACGKALQIPEELQDFSCMYCGRRMRRDELVLPETETDGAEALQFAKEHILECVRGQRDLRNAIRKDSFDETFLRYEQEHGEIFRKLEAACLAEPERSEQYQEELVETFLDGLEALWSQEPKHKFAMEDDKVIIAIYLAPMVRHLKLRCGENFASLLQSRWVERYPKSPFYLGSYEELSAGFRKKYLGLCFITTAVCRQEGKPDDCAELTAFRTFRDGYLRGCPDGPALIAEYYEIAPAIVTMIGVCEDAGLAYGEIRRRWLEDCYRDLQAGRMEDCKARYTEMVRTLERQYLQ